MQVSKLEQAVNPGGRIMYKVKPAVSDVLGSNVLIGYGIAEVLASTIASTVEGGCIDPEMSFHV